MKPLLLFFLTAVSAVSARIVEYDLHVAETPFSPDSGKPVRALLINGTLPGPVLRFREGDTARIRVHNELAKEETSIHWHGLLLPNDQDGVPHVTTPPIQAGTTFTYEFPLRHSGTYWYHSHTGLQEQIGVYGAIVVEPQAGEPVAADEEQVLVLSDWTRESPEEVMRTLARGSDWYAQKKGTIQSLAGASKAGALRDFWDRERSRMPAMDISDVAYDAFLINGRRRFDLPGKPGQTVRLRVVNAAASTYFYLQSASGPLTVVAADGPAVQPIEVNRLLIGMAETYDLVVKIPSSGKWELRATAQDGSGHASAFFGSGTLHPAPDLPKPDNYRMDHHLMAALDEMEEPEEDSAKGGMEHGAVTPERERPLSPYARLRALRPTTLPAGLPRRTLTLRATGDMVRYLWSFDGKTFAEDGIIPIRRGEVLRIELINDTMMHHPLHLHGHFFRVLNGQGDYAPLKHTIDVPPMGKRTIEFEANEPGDWLFHCHLLYHMHAGMTRIFSYQDGMETAAPPPPATGAAALPLCPNGCCTLAGTAGPAPVPMLSHTPHSGGHDHDPLYLLLDGTALSQLSEGRLALRNSRNDWYLDWDVGYGRKEEYEVDLGWSRYVSQNVAYGLGWRFTDWEGAKDRAFAGIDYRLPYLLGSTVQIDSEGDLRFGLGKTLQLTARLSGFGEVQYDTHSTWEGSVGLNYTLTKQFALTAQYHSDQGIGGGIRFRF